MESLEEKVSAITDQLMSAIGDSDYLLYSVALELLDQIDLRQVKSERNDFDFPYYTDDDPVPVLFLMIDCLKFLLDQMEQEMEGYPDVQL